MLRLSCFLFAFLIFIPSITLAQDPELVFDFNEDGDGINEFNFQGVVINDVLIIAANDGSNGEELAVVKDGTMTLLKDINSGSDGSGPNFFTTLNGKVFFSAVNSESGGAIWVTDGTVGGTRLFFDPDPESNSVNERPRELILSKSGHIFFTYDAMLFRIDGTEGGSRKLASEVNFGVSFNQDSPNYGLFKDGVAYIIRGNFNTQLYYATDSVQLLGETPVASSSFAKRYGITEVKEGLIFTLDEEGLFLYNQELDTILPFSSPVTMFPSPSRVVAFNQEKQFGRFSGGFYTYTGIPEETELVLETSFSLSAGMPFSHAIVGDKMIFHAEQSLFGGSKIGITDGTTEGTNFLTTIDDGNPSNMLLYGQNVYLATGVFNSSSSNIYCIGTANFDARNISAINGVFTKNIKLIAGLKDRLYFSANLDSEIGYELYSIEVMEPILSSIYQLEDTSYEILLTDNNGIVKSEKLGESVAITLFDITGRQWQTITTTTNTTFDIEYQPYLNFLVFQIGGKFITKRYMKTK